MLLYHHISHPYPYSEDTMLQYHHISHPYPYSEDSSTTYPTHTPIVRTWSPRLGPLRDSTWSHTCSSLLGTWCLWRTQLTSSPLKSSRPTLDWNWWEVSPTLGTKHLTHQFKKYLVDTGCLISKGSTVPKAYSTMQLFHQRNKHQFWISNFTNFGVGY